jgi:hypothetical protein
MIGQYPAGEKEGGAAHVSDSQPLALEIWHGPDVCLRSSLDAQAARVDAACQLEVQTHFDRLHQVHDEAVGGMETAFREAVAHRTPIGLDELDLEPFLFEEPLFVGHEDCRFAGQAKIANLDFGGTVRRWHRLLTRRWILAAAKGHYGRHEERELGNHRPTPSSRSHPYHDVAS